jgi:flagellar basal-body rod protein FlgB
MELHDTTQLALEAALRGASARQQALTANIANVNTPGYRRMDVDFSASLQKAVAGRDKAALHDMTPAPTIDTGAPVRVDGSTVDLDQEATEQAANGMHYQAIVAVMKARLGILESAMGTR